MTALFPEKIRLDANDYRWIGAGLLALCLAVGGGYWYAQHKAAQVVQESEARANVAKGEADASKSQALAKDKEIEVKDVDLAAARAEMAQRIAELARVKASLHAAPATPPVVHDQPIQPGVVDLAPLVKLQDEVIRAQSEVVAQQETKIINLTASRDLWKGSSEAREREAAGLRIALEAQKSLTKGALWKGRIQGLAVGLGAGYLAGRAH